MSAVAEVRARERAAFRAVVRWRALYSETRDRMARMHPCDSRRLHDRLKALGYAAIEEHQAVERRYVEAVAASLIVFEGGTLQ